MKVIIDTSSLLVIARSYLPFDRNNNFKAWLYSLYQRKELLIIDKVYDECRGLQQGIILSSIDFISPPRNDKKPEGIVITNDILPNDDFYTSLENEYCNQAQKRKLKEEEFEVEKERYVEEADAKMILYAQHLTRGDLFMNEKVTIVTEETPYGTDKKYFKKIPAICKLAKIDCCTLTELLKNHYSINLGELLI